VLLLVSGASCAGKTTVRELVAPLLPEVDAVELKDLGPLPAVLDVPWRQRTTESACMRARTLAAQGRHLLLSGDPVAAGEVLAAPTAADLDIAICLLDVDEATQRARLVARGDPPETHDDHVAFASWMRGHVADPTYLPHVLWRFGFDRPMAFERWWGMHADDTRWATTVVDTSGRTRDEMAADVLAWVRAALAGEAPVFRAGWWRGQADDE
jgi:hypothetical protein